MDPGLFATAPPPPSPRIRFLSSAAAMPFELFENIKTQEQARDERARGKSSPDEVRRG